MGEISLYFRLTAQLPAMILSIMVSWQSVWEHQLQVYGVFVLQ